MHLNSWPMTNYTSDTEINNKAIFMKRYIEAKSFLSKSFRLQSTSVPFFTRPRWIDKSATVVFAHILYSSRVSLLVYIYILYVQQEKSLFDCWWLLCVGIIVRPGVTSYWRGTIGAARLSLMKAGVWVIEQLKKNFFIFCFFKVYRWNRGRHFFSKIGKSFLYI